MRAHARIRRTMKGSSRYNTETEFNALERLSRAFFGSDGAQWRGSWATFPSHEASFAVRLNRAASPLVQLHEPLDQWRVGIQPSTRLQHAVLRVDPDQRRQLSA